MNVRALLLALPGGDPCPLSVHPHRSLQDTDDHESPPAPSHLHSHLKMQRDAGRATRERKGKKKNQLITSPFPIISFHNSLFCQSAVKQLPLQEALGEEQKLFIIPQQLLEPTSRKSVHILLSAAASSTTET